MAPNKHKMEQLDKVFKHVKHDGKLPPNMDSDLAEVLGKLKPNELLLITELNDELLEHGYGVSDEFRVSMV